MCMVDDADRATVERESWHHARKPYRCCECRRAIAIGERYRYCFLVYEGQAESYRTCAHCAVAEDWLRVECHGWLFEAIDEDLAQHVTWWRWNAAEDVEFVKPTRPARLLVGMRRRWRSFVGPGLMPVPA